MLVVVAMILHQAVYGGKEGTKTRILEGSSRISDEIQGIDP